MDCYKIARGIMDMIREQISYDTEDSRAYHGVGYYDSSADYEYFTLSHHGIAVRILRGKIFVVEIDDPRGIVLFNLRLWLLKLDRMTK